MNKFFIISFFIVASFFFAGNANAISGACSSHNGVNCSMGRQMNGKVYCNDGWTESVADYDFMVACKNYKYSCNLEEWKSLSQKYSLENLFSQLQNIIDNSGSNYFFQIQYNAVKNQYDSAFSLAGRECEALGADRAGQQSYERMQSDFYGTQIKNEQDKLAQLEQEKQKLTENYLNTLKNLNTCPANSILNGTICSCNDGYVSNGSACITYTQSCQAKYGANSYGDKQFCHCFTGYEWNVSQTACVKVEAKPITPPPVAKPVAPEISNPKEEVQKVTKPAEKLVVKNEPTKENALTASTSEKTIVPKEEIKKELKSGFFVWVFESIKNFFWNIFK